jgi:hypothetical protein
MMRAVANPNFALEFFLMAIDHDRDFMDEADRLEARKETLRVSFVGLVVAFVLGFGLVSLLLYGRILVDDAATVAAQPAGITGPVAPVTTNTP